MREAALSAIRLHYKAHEAPCHHKLKAYLDEYIAPPGSAARGPYAEEITPPLSLQGRSGQNSFVIRHLLRDVPIGDVPRLLGHSSVKITEMYYAKWISARGSRLEGLVAKTLMNEDSNSLGNR